MSKNQTILIDQCLIQSSAEKNFFQQQMGPDLETYRQTSCRESLKWMSPSNPFPPELRELLKKEVEGVGRHRGQRTPREQDTLNQLSKAHINSQILK